MRELPKLAEPQSGDAIVSLKEFSSVTTEEARAIRVKEILGKLLGVFEVSFGESLTKEELDSWLTAKVNEEKTKMIQESLSHLSIWDLRLALKLDQESLEAEKARHIDAGTGREKASSR